MPPKRRGAPKRGRGAAPPSPAKRTKTDLLQPVADAISMASQLPEDCRAMMLDTLRLSLGVPADERMPCQEIMVQSIGEAVEAALASLEATAVSASESLKEKEGSTGTVGEKMIKAKGVLDKVYDKVGKLEQVAKEHDEKDAEAQEVLKEASDDQKKGDATFLQAKKEKQELDDCAGNAALKCMIKGWWEKKLEVKAAAKEALPLLERLIKMDESQREMMTAVLMKKPKDRGDFEKTCAQNVENELEKKAADLSKVIEEGAPAAQARAAAISTAEEACQATTKAKAEADSTLAEAKAEQAKAERELEDAEEAAAEHEPELLAAREDKETHETAVKTFKEVNVVCFESLSKKAPEAPEATEAETAGGEEIAAGDVVADEVD